MKKTFSINISGNVFHIEEDAFDKLQNYLQSLNRYFSHQPGGQEIISDIESRIAELFRNQLNENQEAITSEWVDEVIVKMGTPEDFTATEEQESVHTKHETIKKRLYRDTEHRVLGGVCSGMSVYFNVDPVFIRILFIVLIFLGVGISAVIYLILWIVVPKATTTTQRLEMRGIEPTISSIQKTIQEEVKEVRNSFSRINKSETVRKGKNAVKGARHAGARLLRGLGRILGILVGALFIFIGFVSLVIFLISLTLGNSIFADQPGSYSSNMELSSLLGFFVSPGMVAVAILLIILVIGIPLLAIFFAGTKMIFRYKTNNKLIGLGAMGIWLVALISGIMIIAGQANSFSLMDTATTSKVIDYPSSQTLYIELDNNGENFQLDNNIHVNNLVVAHLNGKEVLAGTPHLNLESTEGNEFMVSIKRKVRGKNKAETLENLQHIQYDIRSQDSTLLLGPLFTIHENAKWRDQEVTVTVKVPKGKKVHLGKNLDQLYFDFESINLPPDGIMTERTFQMTSDGLAMNN